MTTKYKLLHFDTVDGVDNYDSTFLGRLNGSGQSATASHSYDTRLIMASQIKNVKSITLKTVEIPFLAQNIRSTNKSNHMYFYVKYNTFENWLSITLKDKNYTSITTLLADINTALSAKFATISNLSGFTMVLYVNPLDTSKIVIKANPDAQGSDPWNSFGIYDVGKLTKNILGYAYTSSSSSIPGDASVRNADTYSYINCTNCYNLQPDNYFNISFTNLETAPSNANGKSSTFKIPMDGNFGEVIYYSENESTEQIIYIDRPNTNLSYLNMVITDRWGFPVYGFGSQMSFTLNIEYDDIM